MHQPEASRERPASALESRWKTVSRVTQKYPSADKQYRSCLPSGETEEQALEHIMCLYRQKNKHMERGVLRTPPHIKFMEAVRFLAKCPKFSACVGGGSTHAAGYKPKAVQDSKASEDGSNRSIERPLLSRPSGSKERKGEENTAVGSTMVAKSVDNMSEAPRASSRAKRGAVSIMLEVDILRRMVLPQSVMNAELQALKANSSHMHSSAALPSQPTLESSGSMKSVEVMEDYFGEIPNDSSFQIPAPSERHEVTTDENVVLPMGGELSGENSSISKSFSGTAGAAEMLAALREERGVGRSPGRWRLIELSLSF